MTDMEQPAQPAPARGVGWLLKPQTAGEAIVYIQGVEAEELGPEALEQKLEQLLGERPGAAGPLERRPECVGQVVVCSPQVLAPPPPPPCPPQKL